MAVDLCALFAAKRKKWARDNVCQVIFHKLQSVNVCTKCYSLPTGKSKFGADLRNDSNFRLLVVEIRTLYQLSVARG